MICRLCLNNVNGKDSITLFNDGENNAECSSIKMIAKYLQFEISPDDKISTSICNACWMHLDDFNRFCKYVEQKQLNLHNSTFETKCVDAMDNALDEEAIPEDNNESFVDVKDVFVECDRPACETSVKEFEYANDEKEMTDTVVKSDIFTSHKPKYTAKKSRAKNRTISKTENKITAKKLTKLECNQEEKLARKTRSLKNPKLKRIISQESINSTDEEPEDEALDNNTEAHTTTDASNAKPKRKCIQTEEWKESEKFISNNMRLKCEICNVAMETFAQLQVHFRNVHNCKGYVQCCDKRIDRRRTLVDHIQIHLNPNCFQCKICNKTLKGKEYLDMHMRNAHSNYEDLKFVCTVCGKKFAFKYALKIHNLVHQTEKTFACKLCDKSYVSKHRLNLHLKRIHDNIPHVCDICGKKFRYKPPFIRHMKIHNGVEAKLEQCNICGEWYKFLERHKKIHYETEMKCNICDRICPNSAALKSHILYTHKMERKLKCNFCEKLFKTKNNLEEHIATHTGEKNHQCPHCSKEFRSSANMYVHIKKSHFEEWKSARTVKPNTLTAE